MIIYPYIARRWGPATMVAHGALLCVLVLVAWVGPQGSIRATLAWGVPIVVVAFLLTWNLLRQHKKFHARVVESGNRTCLHCGYDLRGLEEPDRCPECGRAHSTG